MDDIKHDEAATQSGMLDSLQRSRNLVISRALGSSFGCVCLVGLYLLIPTLDQVVANYREITLVEVECVRCNTQLNYCSSDLKDARNELRELRK